MKNRKRLTAVVFSIVLALTSVVYAQTDHLKLGKSGHITLTAETKIGDSVLIPGYYEIRHRHSATGHYMEFTLLTTNYMAQDGLSVYDWAVVAKVPCAIRVLSSENKKTTVETLNGAVAQLNGLQIRGENAQHNF